MPVRRMGRLDPETREQLDQDLRDEFEEELAWRVSRVAAREGLAPDWVERVLRADHRVRCEAVDELGGPL